MIKPILFKIYANSPNWIKAIAKKLYYIFIQDRYERSEYNATLNKLRKIVSKLEIRKNFLFVELNNGIKLCSPLTKISDSKKISLEDAMQLSPIITEYSSILYEKEYEKYCAIQNGDVVVDAGANIGAFTILASKAVGPNGKIIAIEPEPQNMFFLKKNAELNACKNIIFVEKGVADKKGKIKLYMIESATCSMYEDISEEKNKKSITIKIDTLPNILKDVKIKKADFIKMDIEGAEIVAIQGAMPILKEQTPKLSIAAYHYVNKKHAFKTLVPILRSIKYKIIEAELPHIYAKK